MHVNDPQALAEMKAAFAAYEAALMGNDLDQLDSLFWDSDLTVRYGPGQNLYGIDAIRAFRTGRVGGSPQRALGKTMITTYGRDFATADTEFQREGASRSGRQSQTWVRFDGGWKIVSAHISLLAEGD